MLLNLIEYTTADYCFNSFKTLAFEVSINWDENSLLNSMIHFNCTAVG